VWHAVWYCRNDFLLFTAREKDSGKRNRISESVVAEDGKRIEIIIIKKVEIA